MNITATPTRIDKFLVELSHRQAANLVVYGLDPTSATAAEMRLELLFAGVDRREAGW